jgi:hypothetical protein
MTRHDIILFISTVIALTHLSCNDTGSDDGDGINVRYDCVQTIACMQKTLGPAPEGELDECIDARNEGLVEADGDTQAQYEAALQVCGELATCQFVECMLDETGGGAYGLDSMLPLFPEDCPDSVEVTTGEVVTPQFTIPYNDVEILLWKPTDYNCISEIDVELNSGDCGFRFTADDFVDENGRLLITDVSFHASGLCPGYPDGLNANTLSEYASGEPLGTIEVIRASDDWNECAETTVVLQPNVELSDLFDNLTLDLRGVRIELTGKFNWTHFDPSGECPELYY